MRYDINKPLPQTFTRTCYGGGRTRRMLSPQASVLFDSFRVLLELELELIQTHMAQKPLLWVEVGAHAVLLAHGPPVKYFAAAQRATRVPSVFDSRNNKAPGY